MAFLLALGLTLYPVISNYVNQKYASRIHTAYQEVMEQADDSELLKAKELADAYNRSLVPGATEAYSQEAYWQHRQTMTASSISSGMASWAMWRFPRSA